jgi:rSAM/selenodomain-associated transferase 1
MRLNHQPREEVIIFTRYPEPGKVKTRLIPYLEAEKAARVQRLLTERVIQHVLPLGKIRPVQISLLYTGGTRDQMERWLDGSIIMAEQQGENIGERMATALRSAWTRGSARAVLIGSDCPAVDAELIAEALDQLQTHDVVLGPTYDGGYYLIGLNSELPDEKIDILFQDISWGTAIVFHQTVQKAQKESLTIATLKTMHDIDRPEDLEYFRHYTDAQ